MLVTGTLGIGGRPTILNLQDEDGLTLIELLVVLVVLAILAAMVVFAVGATTQNAVSAACNADAKSVEAAVEAYRAQTGSFPATLSRLTQPVTTNAGTVGPWLRSVPGTSHYTVSIDNTGGVYVDGVIYDASLRCSGSVGSNGGGDGGGGDGGGGDGGHGG
jgi:general secretion pathway protein G